MSIRQFWLRMNGKIYGPYEKQAIQQMAAAGTLRRQMEISSDKQTWQIASDVPGLFPIQQINDFEKTAQEQPQLLPPHIQSPKTEPPGPSSNHTTSNIPSTGHEEGALTSLALWAIFGIAAAILFYVGGGQFVWNEPWHSLILVRHGVGNIISDGFVIADRLVAIRFNESIYGIQIINRYFNSPVVSGAAVGASIGCAIEFLRRSFS